MRWGLGPVFAWEWSRTSRRWQTYALRCAVIALLLAAMAGEWFALHEDIRELMLSNPATLGPFFFSILVHTQLTLILLAAPAATAGAICEDKPRGVPTRRSNPLSGRKLCRNGLINEGRTRAENVS